MALFFCAVLILGVIPELVLAQPDSQIPNPEVIIYGLDADTTIAADTPRRVIAEPNWVSDIGEGMSFGIVGSSTSFAYMICMLEDADVVLIGEEHDDPATHRIELDMLNALEDVAGAVGSHPVLGMEMFERDVQPLLDAYAFIPSLPDRTPITEDEFLAGSRPWSNYKTDYRPIVEWARTNCVLIYGSSAPNEIARRVAFEGLEPVFASLSSEQRGWLAAETTASKEDYYWNRFLEEMSGGGITGSEAHDKGMTEDQIYGFYVAQCLKDDTMAETISRLREEDSTRPVVHLSGSFDIDYHLGIYPRLKARRPNDQIVTVAIRPVPDFEEATLQQALADEPGVADYVVFVLKEAAYEPVADDAAPVGGASP